MGLVGSLGCSLACKLDTTGCSPCIDGLHVTACVREPIASRDPSYAPWLLVSDDDIVRNDRRRQLGHFKTRGQPVQLAAHLARALAE